MKHRSFKATRADKIRAWFAVWDWGFIFAEAFGGVVAITLFIFLIRLVIMIAR